MKIEKRSFKVFAAVMTIMLIAGALAGCGDKKADKKGCHKQNKSGQGRRKIHG